MVSFVAVFSVILVSFANSNNAESNHLVTMTKDELMNIVSCVSKAQDPVLCKNFTACEDMMPKKVNVAYDKCRKEYMVGAVKSCSAAEPMYPSPEIPSKIFDCIASNTQELDHEEKKPMKNFETCARALYAENCQDPKI